MEQTMTHKEQISTLREIVDMMLKNSLLLTPLEKQEFLKQTPDRFFGFRRVEANDRQFRPVMGRGKCMRKADFFLPGPGQAR